MQVCSTVFDCRIQGHFLKCQDGQSEHGSALGMGVHAEMALSLHHFRLLRELVNNVPWESSFEGVGVHQCWSLFKYNFLRAQEQNVRSQRGRKESLLG